MAKKIKNLKLVKNTPKPQPQTTTFNAYAKKVQVAKEKKIEKMKDTKQKLI